MQALVIVSSHGRPAGHALLPMILGMALCEAADPAARPFEAVRAQIRQDLSGADATAVAVAVARDGRVLWEEGFGWADRERRLPASEHTMFSLASISKPITATGLMVLVEAGKVDLDRPVNDYLGDAKLDARVGRAEDATVCRVANHTSGLPLHYQFFFSDEPHRRPSMDGTILRYGKLVTAPGERSEYSNLGYGILDHVIGRVSGVGYADFMRENVFLPLGMTRTSVGVPPELIDHQAIRYDSSGARVPAYDFDHPGASAVYASVHDLVRFGMFHLKEGVDGQRPIIPDERIEQMRHPDCSAGGFEGYGLGWEVERRPDGYQTLSHSGGMLGVGTLLMLLPSQRIAVAALSTGGSPAAFTAVDRIMQVMLPDWRPASATPSAPSGAQEFVPDPGLVGEWRGKLHTFASDIPLEMHFQASGDIRARLGQQPETLLDEPRMKGEWLEGRMLGELDTDDVNRRRPYELWFTLKRRGEVLTGSAAAISDHARGNALSHWVELRRH